MRLRKMGLYDYRYPAVLQKLHRNIWPILHPAQPCHVVQQVVSEVGLFEACVHRFALVCQVAHAREPEPNICEVGALLTSECNRMLQKSWTSWLARHYSLKHLECVLRIVRPPTIHYQIYIRIRVWSVLIP